jgi:hypothetical protein
MINFVKYKIRKLFRGDSDELFVDEKAFTSSEENRESQAGEWHFPKVQACEQDLRQFSFLDSTFPDKRYGYCPTRENYTTSRLSPVVLAYTRIDGELLKDLGL